MGKKKSKPVIEWELVNAGGVYSAGGVLSERTYKDEICRVEGGRVLRSSHKSTCGGWTSSMCFIPDGPPHMAVKLHQMKERNTNWFVVDE